MKKTMHRSPSSLEEGMLRLQAECTTEKISIQKILATLTGKGRLIIVLLFALPFCQPIQIPGLSIPFGLVILFLGLRMIFGKHIWLPKKILKISIPCRTLNKITKTMLKYLKKTHKWLHPRLQWISENPSMHLFHGSMIATLGLLLAIPVPIPFINLPAAWALALLSLGLLEEDGLFVMIGYIVGVATLIGVIWAILSLKNVL